MVIQSYNEVKEKVKIVHKCDTKVKGFLWGGAVFTQSLTNQGFSSSMILTTCAETEGYIRANTK